MKKTNKYLLLTIGLLLFFSCKKECSIQQEQTPQSNCETTDLGIDEMSRFSFIWQYPDGSYDFENAYRWHWAEINDTIIIEGAVNVSAFNVQFFFKKNEDSCVDYLFARSIYFDDYVPVGENPYSTYDSYGCNFILQEYTIGDKIVGRCSSMNLWVDFDFNNRFYNPYYYNDTNW